MTAKPFVHLHCHSHYSLLDGMGAIPRLVERAKSHGMNALALTDHGNLHGALEFYKTAKGAGINPIIGYEAYIAPGSRFDKSSGRMKDASYHLTLLCQNRTGFKWLGDVVDARLRRMLREAWEAVSLVQQEHNCSLRMAAQLLAVKRVADADRARGLYA